MDRLLIDDFTGGRNTLDVINELAKNETGDQENTWCEFTALRQRRGFTTTVINVNSKSLIPIQLKASMMGSNNTQRLHFIGRVTADSQSYLAYTDDGSTFALSGYTVGTITIVGTAVTGVGTAWLTHAATGDYLKSGSATVYTQISTVNSDTSITLASAPGDVAGGTSYQIIQKIVYGSPAGIATFDVSGVQNLFIADGSRAYRYNGTDVLRMDNGTTLMPKGKMLLSHKNYLFSLLHDTTTIQWSAVKDATTWPAANFQTVTNAADPTRGFVEYGDYIVIFTRSRMFRLLGSFFDPSNPTYALQQISVPSNFIFRWSRSACVHNGILKFLTADGWYGYIGGPSIQKISQPIQPDTDGFYLPSLAPEAMQDSAKAIEWKKRMWVTVPDNSKTPATQVNSIYVQDERNKWWKWPTATLAAAGSFTDFEVAVFGNAGAYQLMGGCVQTNKISVLDSGNLDDTSVIGGYFVTKEYVYPADVEFIYGILTLKVQTAGTLVVGISIDRRANVNVNVDMTKGAGTVVRAMVPIQRVGKSIRFKFSNAGSNQTFEIYSMELFTDKSEAFRP